MSNKIAQSVHDCQAFVTGNGFIIFRTRRTNLINAELKEAEFYFLFDSIQKKEKGKRNLPLIVFLF